MAETETPPASPDGRKSGGEDVQDLFLLLARLPASESRRQAVRDELIERHLNLVRMCAQRFAGRGVPLEDLIQVGSIGLIHAVDNFDPSLGPSFTGYASPVIVGEIKRHFRDRGWLVRVPRRLQELVVALHRVERELAVDGNGDASMHKVATRMDVTEEEAREALKAARAYQSISLHDPFVGTMTLADTMGDPDARLETVVAMEAVRPALARLARRERYVVAAYYFGNQTQAQIGAALGISQNNVSRILGEVLDRLRQELASP